jgi:hypothetical protein
MIVVGGPGVGGVVGLGADVSVGVTVGDVGVVVSVVGVVVVVVGVVGSVVVGGCTLVRGTQV